MGAAYDVFGNGKTAIKMNLGKYLQAATNDENYWANNPAGRIVTSVAARAWSDGNRNYVIDCDLSNTSAQDNLAAGGDSCGSLGGNDLNFGSANPNSTVVNPAILEGWGIRPSDWQFGVSIQQELLPRVAVNVGYNRRSFQNFFVTDNTLTTAADYNPWSLALPQNPLLPGAGSTANYYNITPAASARGAQNFQTFETDYAPARTTYWHGFDANLNARLRGLNLSGGTTTGRGVRDTCALFEALPELLLVGTTNQRVRFVRGHRAVDDDGQGTGLVHGPEARRRGKRERAVGAERRARQLLERDVAGGERPRAQHRRPADARPPAGQWPGERHDDGQYAQPGAAVRRADHPGGHAVRQDRAVQPVPRRSRRRSAQPAQHRATSPATSRRSTGIPPAPPGCGPTRSSRRGSCGSI